MSKEKQTFLSLLQDFMNIMELPEFQEIDNRLSKINTITPEQQVLSSEQFILILLNSLDFVSDESYIRIRSALYKAIPKIKSLIDKHNLTKQKLLSILKCSKVRDVILYFKYESGEEVLVQQLLDSIDSALTT